MTEFVLRHFDAKLNLLLQKKQHVLNNKTSPNQNDVKNFAVVMSTVIKKIDFITKKATCQNKRPINLSNHKLSISYQIYSRGLSIHLYSEQTVLMCKLICVYTFS